MRRYNIRSLSSSEFDRYDPYRVGFDESTYSNEEEVKKYFTDLISDFRRFLEENLPKKLAKMV
jgi:hypothetical protein